MIPTLSQMGEGLEKTTFLGSSGHLIKFVCYLHRRRITSVVPSIYGIYCMYLVYILYLVICVQV